MFLNQVFPWNALIWKTGRESLIAISRVSKLIFLDEYVCSSTNISLKLFHLFQIDSKSVMVYDMVPTRRQANAERNPWMVKSLVQNAFIKLLNANQVFVRKRL